MKLFVYGTLKRGRERHDLLRGASFLGAARAAGFVVLDLGDYPGMVAGDGVVLGELYEVPAELMPAIDAWEDHPRLFVRTAIGTDLGLAEAYLFARARVS